MIELYTERSERKQRSQGLGSWPICLQAAEMESGPRDGACLDC